VSTLSLEFRYSGGSDNSDPDESFGGAISTEVINTAKPENVFGYIPEASKVLGATNGTDPGRKDYRIIYLKIPLGGTGTGTTGKLWLSANDGISALSYRLAVGTKNTTIAKPANFSIMPSMTFQTAPTSQGSGLVLPDVVAGDYVPIGIERTISATNDLQTNKGPTFSVYWT
jgi:hypothetical protein